MEDSTINTEHIQLRVEDWKKRVSNLYLNLSTWLENTDYTLKKGPKLIMYESLMEKFNVPVTEIETVDILKGKSYILSIKPKGLWIIGANGRLDLLSINKNYILVDTAEQFQNPLWHLFGNDKKKGILFNKEIFLKILNNTL